MKALDRVSRKIGKDTEILTSLNCEMQINKDKKDKYEGVLIATDKGLFFYDVKDMNLSEIKGLDYSDIEKFECNRGLVKSNISLRYKSTPVKFYNIIPGEERELLKVVDSKMNI